MSEALKLISQLKIELPIRRAQMRLRVTFPNPDDKQEIRRNIKELTCNITKEEFYNFFSLDVLIDPGNFRQLVEVVKKITFGKGQIEIIESEVKEV